MTDDRVLRSSLKKIQ